MPGPLGIPYHRRECYKPARSQPPLSNWSMSWAKAITVKRTTKRARSQSRISRRAPNPPPSGETAPRADSMRLFVGTSGYSYPKWKGSFYPQKLPQREMLRYYAERFGAVEINNSFYKMPSASDVKSWASQVPGDFRFAVKAP